MVWLEIRQAYGIEGKTTGSRKKPPPQLGSFLLNDAGGKGHTGEYFKNKRRKGITDLLIELGPK